MPELPDVEGFRRVLASCGQGRRIERVEVLDAGVLRGVSAQRLRRELVGRRFEAPQRHGKWLVGWTDGPAVLLHFGMTGRLLCCSPDEPRRPHDRVVFVLDGSGGELRFRDQRKLQGIRLADAAGVKQLTGDQGPDALEVGGAEFDRLLAGRRGRIKPALMDQSLIAGLGNLTVDEVLWRARLHPQRRADALGAEDRRRLYGAMRRVLRDSSEVGHVPARRSWLTGRRDQADPVCPRCGTGLVRGRVGGRATVWCPRCQPERA